jgi:hypothetical protein
MTLTVELPDTKEPALKAKAEAIGLTAEAYVELLVSRDLDLPADTRSISQKIREIWSDLPEDARALLPVDGASQIDHYVYGWPKRED